MVYLFLKEGFEEAEALVTADVLRRAGAQVALVGEKSVCGAHGIAVLTDADVPEVRLEDAEMLVLPGGLGGVEGLKADARVTELLRAASARGIRIAAICAAPTVLGALGLLEGKLAVCYPGCEDGLGGAEVVDADAVTDGRVTTGKAAGTVYAFAHELARLVCGEDAAERVRAGMYARADMTVVRR